MASRYWVGGTANWDGTAGTKWSTTSGGSGGSAVPTASDDVFLDGNSGVNTVTVSATANCLSLDCTGFTGTLAGSANFGLNVNANLILAAGMALTNPAFIFPATSGTFTITCNGKSLGLSNVDFTGAATYGLSDAFTCGGVFFLLGGGTFNTNNHTMTVGRFICSVTGTTVNLGSSTINISSSSQQTQIDSVVAFNAGTSTIKLGGTGAFSAANKTFHNVELNGNLSTTTAQNNTFNDLKIGADATVTFAVNTTATVQSFSSGGTSGHLATIKSSSAGTQFTLSRATGTNSVSYMSITDSKATGGATWRADDGTSVSGGDNPGWIFISYPGSGFFPFM